MPPPIRRRRGVVRNQSSSACGRFIWSCFFAVGGTLFAIYIFNAENKSLDKAILRHQKDHLKHDTEAVEEPRNFDFIKDEEQSLYEGGVVGYEKNDASKMSENDEEEEENDDEENDDEEENDDKENDDEENDDNDEKSSTENSASSPATNTKNDKKKPLRIALLGERNTGTRWMSAELQRCFPTVTVSPRLLRWKHWFQEDDHKGHNPTLVIAQFRNVYEWTEAMRQVPHHSPYHLKLAWQDFCTKPWSMPRPKRDEVHKDSTEQVCYEKFRYNELISCVEGNIEDEEYLQWLSDTGNRARHDFSGHKPIYELKQDGTGEPFESILHMRAAKIRNFLSLKDWPWVIDSIPVRYEALLSEGTDFLLTMVEEQLGIKRQCEAVPSQQRTKRKLRTDYIQWMSEHVDWETEQLVGYEPWIVNQDVTDDSQDNSQEGDDKGNDMDEEKGDDESNSGDDDEEEDDESNSGDDEETENGDDEEEENDDDTETGDDEEEEGDDEEEEDDDTETGDDDEDEAGSTSGDEKEQDFMDAQR